MAPVGCPNLGWMQLVSILVFGAGVTSYEKDFMGAKYVVDTASGGGGLKFSVLGLNNVF